MNPRPDASLEELDREIAPLGSEIRRILVSYPSVTDDEQAQAWCRNTVQAILAAAVPYALPDDSDARHPRAPQPRARCPLCQADSSDPYTPGFLLAEGLRRHLLGVHNALPCPVFEVARHLARTSVRRA